MTISLGHTLVTSDDMVTVTVTCSHDTKKDVKDSGRMISYNV